MKTTNMEPYQQQSPGYTIPPPPPPPLPSMADPHHQVTLPPAQQISQQQGPWYPGQFHYHPTSSSSSPPPPPPHYHQPYLSPQQQWTSHTYSNQYHHNPALPYSAHQQYHHSQYPPPPRPHMPPPPLHNPYPPPNQEWGNPNCGQHQGWEHPVNSNEEDWAARAKAWSAAKSSMDYQNPQSQTNPSPRNDEKNQYHEQHRQAIDSHYSHHQQQQQQQPSSSYSPVVRLQESAPINSAPASSFVANGNFPYTANDEKSAGDSNAGFSHQESLRTTFNQQEVPSSYSSVAGKGGAVNQAEPLYKPLHFPIVSSQEGHHVQSSMPPIGRSEMMEHPFAYKNHSADLRDQPLDFAPRFSHIHETQMQSSFPHHNTAGPIRGMELVEAVPSAHSWAHHGAPGIVYAPQHDPSTAQLGRIPGPGFQPSIPSASAHFPLGQGSTALHSMPSFPSEAYAYGLSGIPERPKKSAVPNWLREEIIKKKPVISTPAQEHGKEDTQSIEDDGFEKSIAKGDQADSKSIDSIRSTEEEDEDEEYVEAAKTAAINQEIKRILTEVLLKVTDELFHEIATKVLSEDDLTVEVNDIHKSNPRRSLSPPTTLSPKASSVKVVPVKDKESDTIAVTEKYSSITSGALLGLGSYESDDDEEEIHNFTAPNSMEDKHNAGENGGSKSNEEKLGKYQPHSETEVNKCNPSVVKTSTIDVISDTEKKYIGSTSSSKVISKVVENTTSVGKKMVDGINDSELKHKTEKKNGNKYDISKIEAKHREISTKLDNNGINDSKRSSKKEFTKGVESSKVKIEKNGDESCVNQDIVNIKRDEADKHSELKGKKIQEEDSIAVKKRREFVKDDMKNATERVKKDSDRDYEKKRERVKEEKEDRSRHNKPQSESSKQKRSHESRDRNSSDEASEDSRRKSRAKRRNLSPSPVKSRRRQISRSPPRSKKSERRHSPPLYSCLESSRKRR